jgi:nucleotidyltransferase substrate binding protein (TIGR01987 family)
MIDYNKFKSALKHLELQYENHLTLDQALADLIKEGIRESVLQRFETCFDTTWKILKRYLSEEMGLTELPNSPKPVLRIANENNLLASDVSQWFAYLDARNGTAHDYSEDKATLALNVVEGFIDDAIGLYQTMSGNTWE